MTLPAFTLVSASAGVAPYALGHAIKRGDVPAGQQLVASVPGFQATVKSTWPDGSARFAILAGSATLAANTPLDIQLALGTPTGGTALTTADLQATGVTAEIGGGAFGSAAWSGADWSAPFYSLVSGPQMSSWAYRKQIGSDAHLVAWLEVRLYAGGAVEVLPWIENGYLLVAGPTSKSETYTFSLGGTLRESLAINLLNHQRTPLISGTKLTHWLGSDPGVRVRHSASYLASTNLVPTYRATVSAAASLVTGLPATYTPLQGGSHPSAMGSTGYHGSIGLLPEWDVLYLTSPAATNTWAALQRNAYSAGRYGIHFRDEGTNRPIRFSSHPNLVFGGGNNVKDTGASSTNTYTPFSTGTQPPVYASTHSPAFGYMAYLVTGWNYHLETLQFQAAANYLKNGNLPRSGSQGVFISSTGSNTVRGVGWAIRTLAQAAAISSDGDTLTAEFRSSYSSNVNWNHARYVAQANNPQGFIQPYSDYTPQATGTTSAGSTASSIVFPSGQVFTTDGYYTGWDVVIGGEVREIVSYVGATRTATVSPAFTVPTASQFFRLRSDNVYFDAGWQHDFVVGAYGLAKALQIGGVDSTKEAEFFEWEAQSIVGRLGGAGATEYLYRDAGIYQISVAPSNEAGWTSGSGPWYADWGQIWEESVGGTKEVGDGSLRGGNFPDAGSYWGNLQPAIAYAVQHGITGATEAYDRLTGASNWTTLTSNMNSVPVWSVMPGEPEEEAPELIVGPTIRVDTESLVAGHVVVGGTGLGVLGSVIRAETADGDHGPGLPYNDWDGPEDDNIEFQVEILSEPAAGNLTVQENGSFLLEDAPDGTYSISYQLRAGGWAIGSPVSSTIDVGYPAISAQADAAIGAFTQDAEAGVSATPELIVGPTIRVDTESLVAGHVVVGGTGLGVLGSVIRTETADGDHGPGLPYNDWDGPEDDNIEFQVEILSEPAAGNLTVQENGSFLLEDAPDGTYSISYQLHTGGWAIGSPAFAYITVGPVPISAQADATIGAFAQFAEALVLSNISAQADVLIGSFVQSAAAEAGVAAAASQAVGEFTQVASAAVVQAGMDASASQAIGVFTQAAEAFVMVSSHTIHALPAFTQDAAAAVAPTGRVASASQVLGAFTQSAAATVAAPPVIGVTAAQQIGNVTSSAAATIMVLASGSVSIGSFTQSANALISDPITASAAQEIGSFTQSASCAVVDALFVPGADRIFVAAGRRRIFKVDRA